MGMDEQQGRALDVELVRSGDARCADCLFWRPDPHVDAGGACHRFPQPVPAAEHHFCGEFHARTPGSF